MAQPADPAMPPLHVAAAVLRDAHGRVLLTERMPGGEFAGLWEFAGGKLEPGETVEHGLRRELDEELGITIGATRPLITVPFAAPRRRLKLEVLEVLDYRGEPHGREGQRLRWEHPQDLLSVPMPPADIPVAAAIALPALYPITPEPGDDIDAFLAAIDVLLADGVRQLQLRARSLPPEARARLAEQVIARAQAADAAVLLNASDATDIDTALRLGCGLHLTATMLARTQSRPLPRSRSRSRPLAASCHDGAELRAATALGCDFVVLGPVQATHSHPSATPLGWSRFSALREHSPLPIYALGGLAPEHVATARARGAQGVAAISGLWPSPVR